MKYTFNSTHDDETCRSMYRLSAREAYKCKTGIADVTDSLKLCYSGYGGRKILQDIACKPTGVAMGCPLPVKPFTNKLFHLTQLIERCIIDVTGSGPAMAYVPKEIYHITIVNRTHFEENTDVVGIDSRSFEKVSNCIKEMDIDAIEIIMNGLILTANGRLLVRGYPVTTTVYQLRRLLCKNIPELGVNLPIAAHIKLGHLIKPLDPVQHSRVLSYIERCCLYVTNRLAFTSLFTPAGTIDL